MSYVMLFNSPGYLRFWNYRVVQTDYNFLRALSELKKSPYRPVVKVAAQINNDARAGAPPKTTPDWRGLGDHQIP